LAVTADNAAKTYGQTVSLAGTGFSASGLQNGETIGSVARISAGAPATANAGTYAIVPSNATGGSFNPANYTITYHNGTLTVSPAALTITADDKTRPVSATNPPFTGTYSGFAAGDGPGSLAGELVFSTAASSSSPPGGYAIVPSGQNSGNYTITYMDGVLTVTDNGAGATGFVAEYQGALASAYSQGNAALSIRSRAQPQPYEVESTGIRLPPGLQQP
jgi:hypothetical protein